MLADVDFDALRLVVARLSLWDAHCLQVACPALSPFISSELESCTASALQAPRPPCLAQFASARPAFQERCCGSFVLLRTPKDLRVHSCEEGVAVSVTQRAGRVRVEVRVYDPAARPGFAALHSAMTRVRWLSEVFDVSEYRTRATTHRPVTELLNVLVTRFVEARTGAPCL